MGLWMVCCSVWSCSRVDIELIYDAASFLIKEIRLQAF